MRKTTILLVCSALLLAVSCKKDDDSTDSGPPRLVFKFQFDSTQTRLNNFGQIAVMPAGHAAQSPRFNSISAHYIELTQSEFVLPGNGEVLFQGSETTAGGDMAINFDQAKIVAEGAEFFSMPIPLSQVAPGSYEWLRVSLSYQNYEIDFRALGFDTTATVASFVGYNNYITSHTIKDSTIIVDGNRLQGFWAFETAFNVVSGQAPPGATTVPNPIFANSPIPQGSCLVTGRFPNNLVITGSETEDVIVTISLSTNNSFEWIDNGDGIFEPLAGDVVVDMGLRGMIPLVE